MRAGSLLYHRDWLASAIFLNKLRVQANLLSSCTRIELSRVLLSSIVARGGCCLGRPSLPTVSLLGDGAVLPACLRALHLW